MKKAITLMAALVMFAGVAKLSATPSETISLTINDKASCRIGNTIATDGKVKFSGKNVEGTYGLRFCMKDLTTIAGYYDIDKVDVAKSYVFIYNGAVKDTIRMARLNSKVAIKAGDKANSYTVDIPFVGVDSVYYEITFMYADPEADSTVNIQGSVTIKDYQRAQAPYEFHYTVLTDTTKSEGRIRLEANSVHSQNTPYGTFSITDSTLQVAQFKVWNNALGKYEDEVEFSANVTVTKNGTVVTLTGSVLIFGNIEYVLNATGDATGLEEVEVAGIQVYTEGRTIVLNGVDGEQVAVYDMAGRIVCAGEGERFDVAAPGVYVVRVKGQSCNVLVK